MSDTDETVDHPAWPRRALLLASLGALIGKATHWLTAGPWGGMTDSAGRLGAAAFLACGAIVLALALERLRWRWSMLFALACGAVVGFVTWQNGGGDWGSGEGWRLFSSLLAVAVAVPLFQTMRDSGRWRLSYPALHAHSWTDIVLWGAASAFVLAVFLLAQLIAELFALVGLVFLRELLRHGGFVPALLGAAFGAAAGLLRDRDPVLRLLQRLATAILSVLTPFLALGLVGFVAVLPFTGLARLWDQTSATTPILLACVLGAFVLVNATLGTPGEEGPRTPWLRWPAMALAAVMLPLGLVAAVSTGKRVGQYGFTPDRLWACVFVALALAAGLLYLLSLARARRWPETVGRANIALALGVCGLALLLAIPVVSFGALSTSDQLARLESGRIAPDKFDWSALRFDFGPSGRRAVERLARSSPDPRLRSLAARVIGKKTRWEAQQVVEAAERAARPRVVRVLPAQAAIPKPLENLLFAEEDEFPGDSGTCNSWRPCVVYWRPGDRQAIALIDACYSVPDRGRPPPPPFRCGARVELYEEAGGAWRKTPELGADPGLDRAPYDRQRADAEQRAIAGGQVEVRSVTARQVFIGGQPVGDAYK